MTEDQEREHIDRIVRDASHRFAQEYAIVAFPKDLMSGLKDRLNPSGMDLDVIDDGEDDGVPALIVVPRSSALDSTVVEMTRGVRHGWYLFSTVAVCAVLFSVLRLGDGAITMAYFMMIMTGWRLWTEHRSLGRARHLQAHLRGKGL